MYSVPMFDECIEFARKIGCTNIVEVSIEPRDMDVPFQCHKNCEFSPIKGYYIVKDSHGMLHAFSHSVLNLGDRLVDVTPTLDERNINVFCYGSDIDVEHITYVESSVYINKYKQEGEIMYYVYGLIDPRNNQVFYIGKGMGDRAMSHFRESALSSEGNTRKTAKIKKLKSLGYSPMIEFYAQNIEDEELAYSIEASLIKKYGRIDYDKGGVLTNVCEDNRPPNHKGKTYSEIYGEEKAKEQIRRRTKAQLEAGGYGPSKHTEETKAKISKKNKGKNNPRYGAEVKGTETAKKIGEANKGKKHYSRATLFFIEGIKEFVYSNDLKGFCKERGYSLGTFHAQLENDWPTSRRGKNKGLKIRKATETEIAAYITGGLNEDTLKGLSL
jgi:hypothetical protein